MLFHSYTFVFAFLPLVWLGFFLLARVGPRTAIAWLVASSLFFYGWWDPRYLVLLGFSMALNYTVGRSLSARAGAAGSTGSGKALLVFGVALNLGLLGYFKYSNFLVDSFNDLSGGGVALAPVILPLAISFFTFQQIAYLVDAHRGETKEHNVLDYVLFVTFFPQLIAGPIVHHREMLPQFARKKTFQPQFENLAVGLTLFVMGLFKKIVLADGVSGWANSVFGEAAGGVAPGLADAWLGVLAYTFQIYFDFSGYSDMAIGLGRLFGIRLPLNFASPYKASNIIDFWRRWHVTLSRFLRDYLYFSLGGNRKGRIRRHVNLGATMLLGGLWHGAGWNFVIWGGLHGAYLIINHGWRSMAGGLPVVLARPLTFLAVVLAWVFFRAETWPSAMLVLEGMVGLGPASAATLPVGEVCAWLGALWAIAWWAPNSQQILRAYEPVVDTERTVPATTGAARLLLWRPTIVHAVVASALFVTCVLLMNRVREFLYFQF